MKIWPIDATVLFGFLTFTSLSATIMFKKKIRLYKLELLFILQFLCFSLWYYFSIIYSLSSIYVIVKAINYLLVMMAFIVPYFTISSIQDIKFYLLSLSGIGLIISLVMFYLYYIGNSDLYMTYFKLLEYGNPLGIPDYLAIGSPIGLSALILLLQKNRIANVLGFLSVLCLILLSGRGPLLAVIISLGMIFFKQFEISRKTIKNIFLAVVVLFFGSGYLMKWSGMERLNNRLEKVEKGDKSLEERYELLFFSKDLFLQNPVLGIGLGSFGIAYNGIDQRYYPHNILVEILVEQGLIGFFLFMLFFVGFIIFIFKKLYYSRDPIFYILSSLILYEMLNALKSSSIIEHRLLFALFGLCIVSSKFILPKRNSQYA